MAKYPKNAAKNAIHYAIKTGKLKRSVFCESCGLPARIEGHHQDYNKPLKVDWLCNTCHKIADVKRRQSDNSTRVIVVW